LKVKSGFDPTDSPAIMKKDPQLLSPHLIAFIAVSKHKTVHAGARAIHISQTALTQRIQNLEQQLKTTLFIRTRQGMVLTSEGEKLLRYCHVVDDLSKETLADMFDAGIRFTQRVRISGPSSIMASRIIPACTPLMRKFKKLHIEFNIDDTNKIIAELKAGISQFTILNPEDLTNDMVSKNLAAEEYLLVCTSQWKDRDLHDILTQERIIDFDESDMETINYIKKHHLQKLINNERLFVNRTESLCNMLCEGYGYGVLTREFAKPYIEYGDLMILNKGKSFKNSLALAWYHRPEPPKYFQEILKIIV
jgi:DNA-binding transcriptional LysR family regulator